MIKKLLVYFLISTFVFVPHELSTLAQKECKDGICETSMDDLLNYPPNIPSMHKISFLDGQITPDVHFVDKNGQKNFAFFHDHFQTLKNLYYKYLENKLNEKIYYSDDKVAYLNKANRTTFKKQSWWNPKFYWDHIKTLGGYFKCPKEHVDKVESIVVLIVNCRIKYSRIKILNFRVY